MAGFGTFRNSYLYLRDADFSSKALDRFDKEQHNFFGHAEITLASYRADVGKMGIWLDQSIQKHGDIETNSQRVGEVRIRGS